MIELMVWLHVRLTTPATRPSRDERGDVPGWVLITVMTAGLVTMLYGLAQGRLRALLNQALSGVGLG